MDSGQLCPDICRRQISIARFACLDKLKAVDILVLTAVYLTRHNCLFSMSTYLILDNIRSLHNIGSIFRSADGFGVDQLILVGTTGVPPELGISKTALGAENTVDWLYFPVMDSALNYVKNRQAKLICLETGVGSQELPKISEKALGWGSLALVVGSETSGVAANVLSQADLIVKIPMFGKKESFNVSIATAILLYELKCHYA